MVKDDQKAKVMPERERLILQDETPTKKPFPFSVFFILGNEFCERFTFYGMRTILVLYLRYYIKWDANTSTAMYHAFSVLAYLFPLLGGILADSRWGKYNTILRLSIVYEIGMIVNTLGAIPIIGNHTLHAVLTSIGLIVISIGTGGIKPCVSAFGGDQFSNDQTEYRRDFFSLFYLVINCGSLISTLTSPLVREKVKCFGGDCYALAFGIPAILMTVSLISFVAGTKWYKCYPPTGNIFLQVIATVWAAIKIRWNTKKCNRTKEHWLDYALNTGNENLIRDIKYLLNILVIFIPLPLFWTLFDQQGSRWTLQAVKMNGYVGSLRILPDQMQICNPLFIVILIPTLQTTLYPCLRRCDINFRPLQRMGVGMCLAGLSFIVAALLHMAIDANLTPTPFDTKQSSLRVINAADCPLVVNSNIYPGWREHVTNDSFVRGFEISPGNYTRSASTFVKPMKYIIRYECANSNSMNKTVVNLKGKQVFDLIISKDASNNFKELFVPHRTEKAEDGGAYVGIVNTLNKDIELNKNKMAANSKLELPVMVRGSYKLHMEIGQKSYTRNYSVQTGGLYTIVISQSYSTNDILYNMYTDINPNDISIFWMIPQYFIMTLGEVFLSVTGLSFSYTQAPNSMKSVIQSFWLLTVSAGNIVVLIVAESKLLHQTKEYFLFAGLIGIAVVLFTILAIRYQYVDESEFDWEEEDLEESEDLEFKQD